MRIVKGGANTAFHVFASHIITIAIAILKLLKQPALRMHLFQRSLFIYFYGRVHSRYNEIADKGCAGGEISREG